MAVQIWKNTLKRIEEQYYLLHLIKKTNAAETKALVAEVENPEDGTVKEVVVDETFEEEFEINEYESKAFVDEYERYREETRQKKI